MSVVELDELDEVRGLLAHGQQVGVLTHAQIRGTASQLDLDDSDVEELHGIIERLARGRSSGGGRLACQGKPDAVHHRL